RTVRGRYLSGERAGRAEAQQDEFGGAAAAPAQRADRNRGGKPVTAREQGAGPETAAPCPVFAAARTSHAGIGRAARGAERGRPAGRRREAPRFLAGGRRGP